METRSWLWEATGGFEARALEVIAAAGLDVAMVNPRQVRAFARARHWQITVK
jgi:transposase